MSQRISIFPCEADVISISASVCCVLHVLLLPPSLPTLSASLLTTTNPCFPTPSLYAVTDSYTCSGWQTHCAYVTLYRGKLFLLLLLLLLLFVIVVWLYGIIVLPGLWGTGVVRFRQRPSPCPYPLTFLPLSVVPRLMS